MNIQNFLIGCDPEIFVKHKGKLVTAHGLIPGDKGSPFTVNHGAVQVDGMALEFNTDPCRANEFGVFNSRVVGVMRQLRDMLPPNHSFCVEPSVEFDPDYYASCPEEAKILGCDPDFNAWKDGAENPGPDGNTNMRTASGHIHIGWGEDIPVDNAEHLAICCDFVKELDVYVGLLTLFFDGDSRRRYMYGRAGAFRPKPYGVEYRVPSNAWLRHKSYRYAIFHAIQKCITQMSYGQRVAPMIGAEQLQEVINNSDREKAVGLYTRMVGVSMVPADLFRDFNKTVGVAGNWEYKLKMAA